MEVGMEEAIDIAADELYKDKTIVLLKKAAYKKHATKG
jgi:hypothetical protein